MKFKRYLKESEPIKNIYLINKDRFSKTIHLSKTGENSWQIVVDTESAAPTSVRGIKSSLVRTNFTDEKKALSAFDKKVKTAKKKGWKEK